MHAGERSLLYLGGTFSHAVRKVPADGDFRVQTRYGGQNLPHRGEPRPNWRPRRRRWTGVDAELLYARVDLVGTAESPLVMELELIEPELFLPMAPGAAELLAAAIAALLCRCQDVRAPSATELPPGGARSTGWLEVDRRRSARGTKTAPPR